MQDNVQNLARTDALIQQLVEGQELLAFGLVDDLACEHTERVLQDRSAISLVVMSTTTDATGTPRQTKLRVVRILNRLPLINAKHVSVVGRTHVQPKDINYFVSKCSSIADLEGL